MTDTEPADWPAPRANAELLGHESVERELIAAAAGGRLPHAWLIAGREGIGKATLAFRFARFLFAGSDSVDTLAIESSHPVFYRVASGGHADLLTVERQFDEEKGKQRKDIAVDDVRRIAPFLHLTAAEGGWRVVIIDGADGMNRAGQNAVLKILEEPPKGALLLLVTERPSALLPTIRSRCRLLTLAPLSDSIVDGLIARYSPQTDAAARLRLAGLADGSIGRALDIAANDGLVLLTQFLGLARGDPLDWPAAHAFSDKISTAAADESYRSFAQLLVDWLARVARDLGKGDIVLSENELVAGEADMVRRLSEGGRLEQAVEVWEKVSRLFGRSDSANLDRRLTMISAFDTVSAALR
jgi:DNA polymerase-3 subunit delta'